MSNSRYRNEPRAAHEPQPREPQRRANAPLPLTFDELKATQRRRKIIDDAITRLYLKGEGKSLDLKIAICEAALLTAKRCRENEAIRAEQGQMAREKGERPLISPSEARLYMARHDRLIARRDELMADAREKMTTAMERWQPRDDDELLATLEVALGELGEAIERVMRKREAEASAQAEEIAKLEAEGDALIGEIGDERDKLALREAMRDGNSEVMAQVIGRQPKAWLQQWTGLTERMSRHA